MLEVRMARSKRPDPKAEALAAARSLNPHPEAVLDEAFAASPFLDPRDLVQVKYEMVRRVRQEGAAVAAVAAAFGFSRPSWYAAAAALDEAGLPGLLPAKPGPRRAHKLSGEVVEFVQARLAADPQTRPGELVDRIVERFGIRVHPRSIERALARRQQPKSPR
jgi:transposase